MTFFHINIAIFFFPIFETKIAALKYVENISLNNVKNGLITFIIESLFHAV